MVESHYSMPERREKEECMECKNCGTLLEEGQTVCPSCGESVKTKKEKKPWTKKRIIKLVVAIVVGLLVLSLLAGILVLALRKNDINYKKEYTTSDFWSGLTKKQVVATMGDYELTNSRLQVFFWMQVYDLLNYYAEQYGDYAMYYLGIDLDKPLSEQAYTANKDMTWEQYFIEDALFAWHRYQALADAARKANFQMPAEYQKQLAEVRTNLEKDAKDQGLDSVDAFLQVQLGKNVTYDDYYYYLETCWLGNFYFQDLASKLTFTDSELDAYFEENKETLAEYGVTKDSGNLVDFRNILVKPVASKDDNGKTVYTDEAWANCQKKAQEILETFEGGDKLEETFAGLAKIKSEDKNTAANGGLYRYVAKNDLATVDVRHILIMPDGGTKDENGKITYSEAEWEACRASAQALLDQYLAGEKTEEVFGAMANEHSEDQDGKVTNGGLYSKVYPGQMVKEFDAWIFDGSRKSGDTGLVKTQYGYHVMYFVDREGPVDDWLFAEGRQGGQTAIVKTEEGYQILYYVGSEVTWEAYAREGLRSKTEEELMQSFVEKQSMKTQYWAITLSERLETE